MAFADHYPLAAFMAIADASWWRSSNISTSKDAAGQVTPEQRAEASRLDAQDRKRIEAHDEETLIPALQAHLNELRAANVLGMTGGVVGRDVSCTQAWNDFVAGKPETYQTKWLLKELRGAFVRAFVRMDDGRRQREQNGVHTPPSAEQAENAWKTICEAYDSGNSDNSFLGWAIKETDQVTGDSCELQFVGWKAQLMRMNKSYELEVAEDIIDLPLLSVAINVPTGKLLLTDTLRIQGFAEGTNLGDLEYTEASLNSEKGRSRRTVLHAELHEMGFCQTTNTMVNVFVSDADGSIAFMPHDKERMTGWTKIKRDISCDIWRITAIDKANAVKAIAAGGNSDAAANLDRYLAVADQPAADRTDMSNQEIIQAGHDRAYSQNIVQLDVAPGDWIFHCGQNFDKRVDRKALGLPRGAKPWAVLQAPKAA